MNIRRLLPVIVRFVAGSLWATLAIHPYDVPMLCAAVAACGAAASVIATDVRGPWRAVRAATVPVDRVDPRDRVALQHCAQGAQLAGLAVGVLAVLLLFATFRSEAVSPALVALLVRHSMLAPLAGLFVGRVCCGGLVDALGGARPAADRGVAFAALAIAVCAFAAITLPR